MIRIDKGTAPERLVSKEKTLVSELYAQYEMGIRSFSFTKDYNMIIVKETLRERQYNKCCFSEVKFDRDYPNVEHFRPKGRVDPFPYGEPEYPGYYWLAYNWSNLLLCKSAINSSNKRNYFPLQQGSERKKNHNESIIENPILIDPSIEDPRIHIRFHKDEPFGVDDRGRFNVEFFKLRHPELEEARRTKFHSLNIIRTLIEKALARGDDKSEYREDIEFLKSCMNASAEFSSMAIDFLQDWPHFE